MVIDDTLDALGLLCPLPVLKARKRLMALPGGAILCLEADDPAAVVDVPHFCSEAGHVFVKSEEIGPTTRYFIRKAAG